MPEVTKVYTEVLPALRFIGKRYTDEDRGPGGGYGHLWGDWFGAGRFQVLEKLGPAPEHEGAYIGLMRFATQFEYWIGMFLPADTPVPEGFDWVDVPAIRFGTCWVYGNADSGELYGAATHTMCENALEKAGWKMAQPPMVLERYNCPRFTSPDDQGNVILDYCIQLAD